jgi:hypothetical protein
MSFFDIKEKYMLKAEAQIVGAAIEYGRLCQKAQSTKKMEDRVAFVRAEVALGFAALAIYEDYRKGIKSVKGRRGEGESESRVASVVSKKPQGRKKVLPRTLR